MKLHTKHNSPARGFTLIELALVLVVIGLLSGAVLKGVSMLETARREKTQEHIQSLTVAWFEYISQYQQLPGDDNQAAALFGGDVVSGNGNGVLEAGEGAQVWAHLRANQQITGAGEVALKTPWGNNFNFTYVAPFHALCIEALSGERAMEVDRSLDDALPQTGQVQVQDNTDTAYATAETYTICSRL